LALIVFAIGWREVVVVAIVEPDLPGACDLAPVRARLVNVADGARHSGDLSLAA
jgi:hypothetical protein